MLETVLTILIIVLIVCLIFSLISMTISAIKSDKIFRKELEEMNLRYKERIEQSDINDEK